MIDLEKEARRMRHAKLQCGIFRYIENGNGWRYVNSVRMNFVSYGDEEFSSVVAEMVAEGMLTKLMGRDGGIKLVLSTQSAPQENNNGQLGR